MLFGSSSKQGKPRVALEVDGPSHFIPFSPEEVSAALDALQQRKHDEGAQRNRKEKQTGALFVEGPGTGAEGADAGSTSSSGMRIVPEAQLRDVIPAAAALLINAKHAARLSNVSSFASSSLPSALESAWEARRSPADKARRNQLRGAPDGPVRVVSIAFWDPRLLRAGTSGWWWALSRTAGGGDGFGGKGKGNSRRRGTGLRNPLSPAAVRAEKALEDVARDALRRVAAAAEE